MLVLKNITKTYATGDTKVEALRGVSVDFRRSEFVSILGQSGCGKTTLLNIIGGLDRYTSGDLIIDRRSTKEYRDRDWDTYRNHSVGFVFQSYNLIPHQTVLANVELALTLSGVSRAERRRRATEVLEKVGLGDQLHKKPNQMSGGQMQRVAIARALVNDPDILLADEPTGALDTETSVQVMELLKDIAHEKLVIMVTHNPELAEQYSDRIIRMLDGRLLSDSNPYDAAEDERIEAEKQAAAAAASKRGRRREHKPSMSMLTALSLSFNNLLTKKGRTFMTSFAGSIGIIGIALILSLSSGINAYIAMVQEDTLSTYPLSIQAETQDMTAMLTAMTGVADTTDYSDSNMIHVDDSMGAMVSAMNATVKNDLAAFKAYLEEHRDEELADAISDIRYTYDFDLQVFSSDGKTQISPTKIFDNMGDTFSGVTDMMDAAGMSGNMSILSEMIDNRELLDQQYELVEGHWPTAYDEVVLVISGNNQLSKMTMYMLGVLDQSELEEIMTKLMTEGVYDTTPLEPYTYDYFLDMTFRLLNTSDFYEKTEGMTYTVDGTTYPIWHDVRDMAGIYDQQAFVTEHGTELKISGIIRPREGVTATSITGAIGYTKALTEHILDMNSRSEVIGQQKATPDYNVLTGLEFERTVYTRENIGELIRTIDSATMETFYTMMTAQVKEVYTKNPPVTDEQSFLGFVSFMSNQEVSALLSQMLPIASARDAAGLATLCSMAGMRLGVSVTPDNVVALLPALTQQEILMLFAGVPAGEGMPVAVPGLVSLCGTDAMASIYGFMNEQIMAMSVDENTFPVLLQLVDDEQFYVLQETLYNMAPSTDATYESTMKHLGNAEYADPIGIHFYAKDFASKDAIEEFIERYNDEADDAHRIRYTDLVGVMMSSVTTIVNVISYVLIAFVSISLVVSSIMIGIITYISVLERTKEIGILRAMGASKKDISRVFNAETLIIGLCSGAIGILATVLLCLPVNAIVRGLSGIPQLTAYLPLAGGIALVIISMVLTVIAGLIPSRVAAKKDPVVALRTE